MIFWQRGRRIVPPFGFSEDRNLLTEPPCHVNTSASTRGPTLHLSGLAGEHLFARLEKSCRGSNTLCGFLRVHRTGDCTLGERSWRRLAKTNRRLFAETFWCGWAAAEKIDDLAFALSRKSSGALRRLLILRNFPAPPFAEVSNRTMAVQTNKQTEK